jgi:hypothetical protein
MPNPAWAPALWSPNPQPDFPPEPEPPEPGIAYDPWETVVLQHADWTCSCASGAWILNSLGDYRWGRAWNEWDVVNTLRDMTYPGAVDPAYGLARADMYDLETMFRALGYTAERHQHVGVADVIPFAGVYPCQINGARWYHHVGLRTLGDGVAYLANPAPTWRGVGQQLDSNEAATWGSWNLMAVTGMVN